MTKNKTSTFQRREQRSKRTQFISRVIIILLILFLIFYYQWLKQGRKAPDFTIYSTRDEGAALFHDSLKKYGLDVKVAMIEPDSPNESQILIEPTINNKAYLDSWLERGGRMILATDHPKEYFDGEIEGNINTTHPDVYHVNIGHGEVVIVPSESLLNGYLKENRDIASQVAFILEDWNQPVYFNEFYHGYSLRTTKSTWQEMPVAGNILIIQLGIFAVLIVLAKGKRFGEIETYYDEEERIENESIKALANLYHHTKYWSFIGEEYKEELIRQGAYTFKTSKHLVKRDFESYWKQEELEHFDALVFVLNHLPETKREASHYVDLVNTLIETLKEY